MGILEALNHLYTNTLGTDSHQLFDLLFSRKELRDLLALATVQFASDYTSLYSSLLFVCEENTIYYHKGTFISLTTPKKLAFHC